MPDPIQIVYNPPPTLNRMMMSNDFVRVVVGPIGSGKSSGCVMELLRRAAEQKLHLGKRRSRWAVIRGTYPQLRDTTKRTFEQWIPSQLGKWHVRDFIFELKTGDIEAEILFRALDQPKDVRNLLSLELTGAYINEIRETPKAILDALTGRVRRYPSRAQGGFTWSGIWADTNPWHSQHWAAKLFKKPPKGYSLYRQPGGRSPEAENLENLDRNYYEDLISGKDSEWLRVYVDGQDASSDQGSIYGSQVSVLESDGKVSTFDHPNDGVYTSWDLGISDATAIWFWRVGSNGIDVIDYYEGTGLSLSHFMDEVEKRGYNCRMHWLPHDARARTLATGTSVLEQASQRWGGKVQIAPGLSVLDGIQAARALLESGKIRFHSRCEAGLDVLKSYHYQWDEDNKCFSRVPVHDSSSHGSDAFRYLATTAKVIARKETQKQEETKKIITPAERHFTLDALWAARAQRRGRERI